MFSTQIALMHRGRLVVGVSSAPAYGELAWGEAGVGAWLDERPIRVSDVDTIEGAALSTGNLKTLATGPRWPRLRPPRRAPEPHPRLRRFPALPPARVRARSTRCVESDVNILDIAACAVIVEAAGGRFTDLDGQAAHAREHVGARHQRPAARTRCSQPSAS